MSASRRVRKTGGGAGVGVDAGEVGGGQGETAVGVFDGGGVVEEEGTVGLVEAALLAAEDKGAEFEAGVDVWEEGRKVRSEASVFEVEEAADAGRGGGDGFEEAGGGLVGVDAGGGEQADDAVGFGEAHGAFDEEGVEVDVARRRAAGSGRRRGMSWPRRSARSLAASNSEASGSPSSRSCLMPRRRAAAVGARASSGERVANHSTSCSLIRSQGGLPMMASKPAGGLVVLPAAPDAGKGDFPVEEVFAVGDLGGGAPDLGEVGPGGVLADGGRRERRCQGRWTGVRRLFPPAR